MNSAVRADRATLRMTVKATFGLTILILFSCPEVFAGEIVGRVVGVSDGDTITVLDGDRMQHKIRLAGIDEKWLRSLNTI